MNGFLNSSTNYKYNLFVIPMNKTTFEYINNLVATGEYRINQARGVLETKAGHPVLWNGHSITVCESAHHLSSDELDKANNTLTQFRAFTVKNARQVEACSGTADNNGGLDKERVAALFDQWVEESEAYLKKNCEKAQAAIDGIDHELDGYDGKYGQEIKRRTLASRRRYDVAKQRFDADAEYLCQVKANQAIRQLFWQLDTERFKNEGEVLAAIKNVAADYHREQQNRLLTEVVQLSELLVREARMSNKVLVFPGRSLIACAAYIEKKYPEISVVKVPISSVGHFDNLSRAGLTSNTSAIIARALSLEEIMMVEKALIEGREIPEQVINTLTEPMYEKGDDFKYLGPEVWDICDEYIASYLDEFKERELMLVDYVVSGEGLKNFADMVAASRRSFDGLSTLAVFGNSISKGNKLLEEFKTIAKKFTQVAGCFAGQKLSGDSPLVMLLTDSTFDGFSPYGKQTIENIIRGIGVTGNTPEDFAGFDEIGSEAAELVPSESYGQPEWRILTDDNPPVVSDESDDIFLDW
ncbi:hypothetical protein [Endozoicomonas sp. SCSIO W0465]|uniref:hypothetical protein n=1 Tax=Endozoicomonas sp. SCSIO W0465 TaxID=2918516 RepID=UPI002075E871|nr:hypothetical protein [Endozoicomonas sp. SCSIO W0465]USE37298.1 hypothetical protein MJO57_03465 [Endozoicomonas sp. SCSIO W0465]